MQTTTFSCAPARHASSCVGHPLTSQAGRRSRVAAKAAKADVKHAEMIQKLDHLVELKMQRPDLPEAEVEPIVQEIISLSNAAGTNVMDVSINTGTFRGFTLSGNTHKRFQSEITLGTLTFNAITPVDLKVRMLNDERPGVHKGPRYGRQQAYCVEAYFTLVDYGVEGISSAVASYSTGDDPKHPARLTLAFEAQRLTPVIKKEGDLEKWIQAFGADNPKMVDKTTGVIENAFPASMRQKGYLDHVVMLPDYHLVVGNAGSKTLLKRAA